MESKALFPREQVLVLLCRCIYTHVELLYWIHEKNSSYAKEIVSICNLIKEEGWLILRDTG